MTTQEDRLVELLQAKRREDPKGFVEYLPGVSELLSELPPGSSGMRLPSALTNRELSYHREGLSEALGKLGEGVVTVEEAAKGLRHCANLIRDDSLTEDVGYEELKSLVRAAIGKSPSSYTSKTTVPVGEANAGPSLERVSAIRGVYLDLDRDGRLVSVSIHPGKVRERRKLMEFVGASRDPDPDVASRHDDYLAMQDPHGTA